MLIFFREEHHQKEVHSKSWDKYIELWIEITEKNEPAEKLQYEKKLNLTVTFEAKTNHISTFYKSIETAAMAKSLSYFVVNICVKTIACSSSLFIIVNCIVS